MNFSAEPQQMGLPFAVDINLRDVYGNPCLAVPMSTVLTVTGELQKHNPTLAVSSSVKHPAVMLHQFMNVNAIVIESAMVMPAREWKQNRKSTFSSCITHVACR
jgi:hypothetical protein